MFFPAPNMYDPTTPPEMMSGTSSPYFVNFLTDLNGSIRPGPQWIPIAYNTVDASQLPTNNYSQSKTAQGLFIIPTFPAGMQGQLNMIVAAQTQISVYQTILPPIPVPDAKLGTKQAYPYPLYSYPPLFRYYSAVNPYYFATVSGGSYGPYGALTDSFIPTVVRFVAIGSHVYAFVDTDKFGGIDINSIYTLLRITQGATYSPTRIELPITAQPKPIAPTLSAATGTGNPGTYNVAITFVDAYGNETDLSPQATITLTGSPGAVGISINTSQRLSSTINIYGSLNGGTTLYYIAQVSTQNLPYVWSPIDTQTAASTSAPNPGEKAGAPINYMGALHKSRLWVAVLPQVTQTSTPFGFIPNIPGPLIACSNVGAYENFANPTGVDFSGNALPNDGTTIQLSSDTTEYITGLVSFSDVLAVLTNKSVYAIFGDNPNNFSVVKVLNRGCVAKDSVVRIAERVFFLSDTGVYSLEYGGYFAALKVSDVLEAEFNSMYWSSTQGKIAYQMARGWNIGNVYYLAINNRIYRYAQREQQWSLWTVPSVLGNQTIAAAASIEALHIPGSGAVMLNNDPRVWLLDTYLNSLYPAAIAPNSIWRTYCVGENETERSKWKRLQRVRLIGSGPPVSGILRIWLDGAVAYTQNFSSVDLASHVKSEIGWFELGSAVALIGRNIQIEWEIDNATPNFLISGCECVYMEVRDA